MDVLMPQLGETVAEGKITKWFKSAGEHIKPGDSLFEIETDKVSMEVPSTTTGILVEIRVPAGAVVPVGTVVGVIGDGTARATANPSIAPAAVPPVAKAVPAEKTPPPSAAAAPSPPELKVASTEVSPPPPASAAVPGPSTPRLTPAETGDADAGAKKPLRVSLDPFLEVRTPERNYGPARLPGGIAVTPLARRLASEAGIDLSQLHGSGPHGRIVARDIGDASRPPRGAPTAGSAGPAAAEIKALYQPGSYEEVPLDGMRRTIAFRLTEAAQTIPHFYLTADIDIGRLIALREEANNAAAKDKDGKPAFKLSLNDFIIRALALALQAVPAANAVWAGDRILRFRHSDIGVAVALEGGLITPVIRSAETKSLSAISVEMKELAARARDRKLMPGEYQGGASAITNLGMHGVREFSAIINPPHATILAIGAARRQAVETENGGVAFASMLSVTLSCDHRVVDGALGAELLTAVKTFMESPVRMLV
jgi:pyruvate dehydrogenase E2 component (dihydrolipoamide acetyltransferase)